MASPETIDEVIGLIVNNYDPDEIILFGSHARGSADGKSDVDLLILKETDEPFPRRVRTVEHLLAGMLLRFDINVYTRAELDRAMEHPFSLIHRIVTRQGRQVYNKRFPDYEAIVEAWEKEQSAARHARLTKSADEWRLFHFLYGKARSGWTKRPCDAIAERLRGVRANSIADFGCGDDARLAMLLQDRNVISIDHVAPAGSKILAADIAATGLQAGSMDAVVIALALIGMNWRDYLREANRLLRPGSFLFVAEPLRRAGQAAFRLLDAMTAAGFSTEGDTVTRDGIVYATGVKVRELEPKKA